jgi:hypothetical protein
MGSQPLNQRNLNRVSRETGLDLVRAVAHGGTHWLSIVTSDHRHGSYDRRTGRIEWDDQPVHFTSCSQIFGRST